MHPVRPASGEYALGVPLFERAVVTFPDNGVLVVFAPPTPDGCRCAKDAFFNGAHIGGNFISSSRLKAGGELRFAKRPQQGRQGGKSEAQPEASPRQETGEAPSPPGGMLF